MVLPSLCEQDEIANALETIANNKRIAENLKMQLQDLFRTSLHELMMGKARIYDIQLSGLIN